MDIHVKVKSAELREFFLIFPENLVNNGPLSMHYFIMRQRQQMALIVIVIHGKCQKLRTHGPLIRSFLEIIQCIIHPAKIPLVVKSQTAVFDLFRAAGIGCAVLRDQNSRGVTSVDSGIHFFQELHSCLIDTAQFISHPINDTADRVHPQAVKVIFGQPVISGRLHEAGHFAAGENKVAAAPLTVGDIAGRIFIELSPVIHTKTISIQGKMGRHKIQDRAYSGVVKAVDQFLQLIGSAIARGRTEKSRALVSPASVERML